MELHPSCRAISAALTGFALSGMCLPKRIISLPLFVRSPVQPVAIDRGWSGRTVAKTLVWWQTVWGVRRSALVQLRRRAHVVAGLQERGRYSRRVWSRFAPVLQAGDRQ